MIVSPKLSARRPARFLSLLVSALSIVSCGSSSGGAPEASPPSFAFQLQDIDLDALAESRYQTIVIDYSSDGTESGRFSREDIGALRASGKTVLAYLSIGEAEDYRWYWDPAWDASPPSWLGVENPDWEGNYKVRYWDPLWRGLIFNDAGTGSLDKILDSGFDGVYLDIVDAYWYWGSEEAPDAGESGPYSSGDGAAFQTTRCADDMASFVAGIAAHARERNPSFIVCPQNATAIIDDMSPAALGSWWSAIDAVGAEDAFFYGDAEMDNTWNPQESILDDLDDFSAHGKTVFSIEYLSAGNGTALSRFAREAEARGFGHYAADRPLDTLR